MAIPCHRCKLVDASVRCKIIPCLCESYLCESCSDTIAICIVCNQELEEIFGIVKPQNV